MIWIYRINQLDLPNLTSIISIMIWIYRINQLDLPNLTSIISEGDSFAYPSEVILESK